MRSNLKTAIITAALALPLGFAAAGPLAGHPNLKAADRALATAYKKITAAQKANEFDLGGHAAKAKDAIQLAVDELKLAAETANENK